jgi:hypothetical protein
VSCYRLTTSIYPCVSCKYSTFTIFIFGMLLHSCKYSGRQVAMAPRKFSVRCSICDSTCSCFWYAFVILEFPAAYGHITHLFIPRSKNCVKYDRAMTWAIGWLFFVIARRQLHVLIKRIHKVIILTRLIVNTIVSTASLFFSRTHLILFFVFSLRPLKYNLILLTYFGMKRSEATK